MNKSRKSTVVEYPDRMFKTAFLRQERIKLFKEIKSSFEFFNILENLCVEIDLKLKFLKANDKLVSLWMLKSTSEIYEGITYLKNGGIDVLDVEKDSRAFDLYIFTACNYLKLCSDILGSNLYEKFFYFRYFETKHFLN